MVDLATLALKVDSTDVKQGVGELDRLTAAGTQAQGAIDRLGDTSAQAGKQVRTASQAAADMAQRAQQAATSAASAATNVGKAGTASGLAAHHVQNLAFQANDLFVGLASGQKPMTVFVQQGAQIGQIMAQAGIGVGGLTRAVGGMVVSFGRAHPILVGLALAAGIAAGAMKLFTSEIEKSGELKRYADGLGLTHKEMKKLEDVGVTAGDVFRGLYRTFDQYLGLTAIFSKLKTGIVGSFKAILVIGTNAAAGIYAGFVGTFNGIANVWSHLPAVLGDAAYSAANLAIAAIEGLINRSIKAINAIIIVTNPLLAAAKLAGINVGLSEVSLGRLTNPYSGAGHAAADKFLSGYSTAFNQAKAAMSRFGDTLAANIIQASKDRLASEADDIIGDRTEKAAKKAGKKAGETFMEKFMKELEKLNASVNEAMSGDIIRIEETLKSRGNDDFNKIVDDLAKRGQDATDSTLALADAFETLQLRISEIDFSSAFGNGGAAINGMLAALSGLQKAQIDYQDVVSQAGISERDKAKASSLLRQRELNDTRNLLGAAKHLFAERSAGYKAVEAAERALAVIQAINTVKSVAAGAAKIFSQLGVWAFPVVGAMIAVMAGLGFSGGSSSQAAPTSSQDLQDAAGTGSVLGDPTGKSASIANSLEIVAANSNRDLEYTSSMLRALRSIDSGIAALSGNIAKQISVSGSLFDTGKLKLGQSGSGGFLGIGASSTDRSLYDLGLTLNSASVADIIANGISGQTYQIVQQVKKKSGFFGIGGGTKTTYETTTGSIDATITQSIAEVVASLRNGLVEASKVIGLEGAQAMLDGFQVSLGKISFAGLTGQEIEDQLNAIFSKVGDDMAGTVLPSLKTLQQVGEGLFETFIRVAREYQVVDTALESIGKTFGAVGVSSLAARDELVQLFGSLDEFAAQTEFFGDKFLTEAERIAPVAASVRAELARLGLSGVATREQFKSAVLGIDLTTTAGRELYASLLAVAPAFDKVAKYAEDAAKVMADGFKKTVTEFEGYAASLTKYRDSLRAGNAQGSTYAAARAAFLSTADLAAQGNATGLAGLENAGKSFLDASRSNASTLLDYQRDVARVANAVDKGIFAATETADYAQLQLDALTNSASILASIDAGIANVQTLLGGNPASPATVSAPAPSFAPTTTSADTLAAENKALLTENKALLMQVAENTSSLARLWSRIDGDGLLVRTDADTPLQTEVV